MVFARGEPQPLYDPAAPPGPVTEAPEPVLPAGVPLRPVGDFVGRRAELRTLVAALRHRARAGAVIHGIGGVGKSSLAAELLRLLGQDIGIVVPVVGATGADAILAAFGQALFTRAIAEGLPERHPWRQLSGYLRMPGEPWQERLTAAFQVLAQQPVTLLIDNFETNLDEQTSGPALIRDDILAEFLAAWAVHQGPHRLLVTSRYPFELPGNARRRLVHHHLGPLSLAETRKLIWRLPGLDALTPEQQRRACTDVGGHPRTLEYLDALLRKGQARFDDVTDRLEQLLADRGITAPDRWLDDLHTARDGDDTEQNHLVGRALAEAVTLTVNDSLLDRLLGLLDPAARTLLIGAAVYRQPIDQLGLAWQIHPPAPNPTDPERDQRLTELTHKLDEANTAGQPVDDWTQLGYTTEQVTQLRTDITEMGRPPLSDTTVDAVSLATLDTLGLLVPIVRPDDNRPQYVLHRWTAAALARLHPDATTSAHHRAAAYYTWRVQHQAQDKLAELYDQIEARYHHYAAANLTAAVSLSYEIRDQLHTWAAWDWETSICHETLTWLPPNTYDTAAFTHQLGILAQARGDYAEAERRYQQSLTIGEELGDRAGMASSYHQLGNLAYLQGDYAEAERRYQQSLTVNQELGNRAGMAGSYHQLGILAYLQGDYAEAERRYQQSLTVNQELGNRAGMAGSYHQLGILAYLQGDYAEAERRYQQSLTIGEQLGNRAGMATSYGQLGILAQDRGDYAEAERRYQQSLTIDEELGNRAGMATSYHQLGMIAQDRGDYAEAERRYQQSLTIGEQLGNRAGMAGSYHQLGILAYLQGDYAEAERRYQQSLTINQELGNRAGMAISISQLGTLRTETGDFAEAVTLHCQALVIRLGIGLPQAGFDIARLRDLRAKLCEHRFSDAVTAILDEQSSQALTALLDQTERPEQEDGT
ncbi:tetratricopeptide repeat protein [Verrucosispora sp. CWR15]|uniref:Tetratricopeptide repeat protein n=1 Tax=Verrucosispora sioxanthis TaxID=2499994 RepID=A0A6M1KUI1_9ACTN|nr:tetratricopeptide repeat protein [Verrucosispora sioxanthis]NGM12396.1 tetratricopeptide repeat protein [Verrucosispora sioxanthis]